MKDLLIHPSSPEDASEWLLLKRTWPKPLGPKNKSTGSEKGHDLWLLTLSDLLLLLMIFFVLLFGMTLHQQRPGSHSPPQAAAMTKLQERPVEMQPPPFQMSLPKEYWLLSKPICGRF